MIQDVEKKTTEIRKRRTREQLNGQLKPCPFCGGKAHIRNVTENDEDGYVIFCKCVCVLCENCGAQSIRKISDGYYGKHCSDEEIAELWNHRVKESED